MKWNFKLWIKSFFFFFLLTETSSCNIIRPYLDYSLCDRWYSQLERFFFDLSLGWGPKHRRRRRRDTRITWSTGMRLIICISQWRYTLLLLLLLLLLCSFNVTLATVWNTWTMDQLQGSGEGHLQLESNYYYYN